MQRQRMIRRALTHLMLVAGAAGFAPLGGCSAGATTSGEEHLGSTRSALTAEQCDYFAACGKVTLCHRTHSTTHPYTILEVCCAPD